MKKQNFVNFIKFNLKSFIFLILIALWLILIFLLFLICNYKNIFIEIKAILGAITIIYLLLIIYLAIKTKIQDKLEIDKKNYISEKEILLKELEYKNSPYVSIVNQEREKLYKKLDSNYKTHIIYSKSNKYLIAFEKYKNSIINDNTSLSPEFFSIAFYLAYSILNNPVIKVKINKKLKSDEIKEYKKIQKKLNIQIAINSAYTLVSNYYETHNN